MRLDKYLKVSRLIKRRTLANEVADAGRVTISLPRPAMPSKSVMSSRSPSATALSKCGCWPSRSRKARMSPANCLRSSSNISAPPRISYREFAL